MKAVLFTFLLAFTGTSAHALEQCNSAPKSSIVTTFGGLKIMHLEGDYAKDTYVELDTDEVKPEEGDVAPADSKGALAKYTKDVNCFKFRPAKYLDGFYFGPADCETYTCNVIRR